MPKKPPALKFIPGKGFEELVKKLNDEFSTLETFLRNRTVESVKKAGRYIHSHILENKDRADYGKYLFPELAKRTGKDESTLRGILRFERVYAIQVVPPELTWEHCRNLMAVKDEAERKNIEKKVARFHWTSAQLREYLSNRRKIEQIRTADGPIPQLKLERGLLYTYQIIEPAAAKIPEGHIFVDCGFNNWESIASAGDDLKPFPTNGDIVESVKNKNGRYSLKKSGRLKKDLYTFKSTIERVVDGDTLWVVVDCGFNSWRKQELRLRGIDCPEMDTEEGKAAKRFVEARLKPCEFVVIKTYKSEKYGRYLADVFYKAGEKDPAVVASEGTFLSQELLDNRLAVIWKG